jgi:hypothetical protein
MSHLCFVKLKRVGDFDIPINFNFILIVSTLGVLSSTQLLTSWLNQSNGKLIIC